MNQLTWGSIRGRNISNPTLFLNHQGKKERAESILWFYPLGISTFEWGDTNMNLDIYRYKAPSMRLSELSRG